MRRLGVDATVSPTTMMLALIEEELSAHPAVHLMTLRQAGIELMEFIIPGTSPAVGKSLSDLQFPAGTTLPLVVRGTETIRPTDATVFAAEDSVIALLPIVSEPEVREILMGSVE
jgi:trk system potassium uptake protein TrkA